MSASIVVKLQYEGKDFSEFAIETGKDDYGSPWMQITSSGTRYSALDIFRIKQALQDWLDLLQREAR